MIFIDFLTGKHHWFNAYREQTPAASANKGGANVAPDFTRNLILPYVLTENITSWAAPTGLRNGETGALWVDLSTYALPASAIASAYHVLGPWDVSGPDFVLVTIQRVGSYYYWTASSGEAGA